MERKQIIYINEINFVCDFVKNLCKTRDLECFTLNETSDFTYLIDDLKPQLIVINHDTFEKNQEQFQAQVEQATHQCEILKVGNIDGTNFANEIASKLE